MLSIKFFLICSGKQLRTFCVITVSSLDAFHWLFGDSKKYKFFTSFALRDVIEKRIESYEDAEFVKQFDPERWDYYRIKL